MMPEQQSFVLYIVVRSGSKSGSRLPKTAPGAVFKVRLDGSLATGQKTAPGFQKWLGEPPQGEAVCSKKRHKIGSPALETSSGAAPTTCLFFAVEFAGWGLAYGVYSWRYAGCVWPPSYQFPWQYKRLLWPKIGGLLTHKQCFQSSKNVTLGLWWTTLLNSPTCG